MANHAANLGAREVCMVGSHLMEQRASSVGVTRFIDYRDTDQVTALADSEPGYDFVVDAIGRQGNLDLGLSLLRAGGTLGLYGLDDYNKCTMPAGGKEFRFFPSSYDESESHYEVVSLMREGRLRASDYLANVDSPAPLEEIASVFADLVDRRIGPKALIQLRSE
jgi:D-arabinose 1-dehydrogenase-like Zn-dependent alcohol dehydrogenase